jgi:uncharacterized membrane protein YoaK (UPF0700 family)
MYRLTDTEIANNRFISLWSLLAFQAGFINSIAFLACRHFVSHITGFGTQLGIAIGAQSFWDIIEAASAPFAFILGACSCGILTVARRSRGLTPRYDIATSCIPILLLGLLIGGNLNLFGTFGVPIMFEEDFIFLSILSFVCGMQNATFATLTRGQIRTTHLTGLVTDFGTDMALVLFGNLENSERSHLKRKNFMRTMTLVSFSSGALISSFVDSKLKYWSLAIPLVTSLFVSGIFFIIKYEFLNLNRTPTDLPKKVRMTMGTPIDISQKE